MREEFFTETKYVFTKEEIEEEIANISEGGLKEKYNKLCEKYLESASENEQIIFKMKGLNNYGTVNTLSYHDSIMNFTIYVTSKYNIILGTNILGAPMILYRQKHELIDSFNVDESVSLIKFRYKDSREFSITINEELLGSENSIEILKGIYSQYCKVESKENIGFLTFKVIVVLTLVFSALTRNIFIGVMLGTIIGGVGTFFATFIISSRKGSKNKLKWNKERSSVASFFISLYLISSNLELMGYRQKFQLPLYHNYLI